MTTFKTGSVLTTGGTLCYDSTLNAVGSSATTSVTATYPAATTAGRLLVATVSCTMTGSNLPAISGWTGVTQLSDVTTLSGGVFYKQADGTETTVTATCTAASIMRMAIYQFPNNLIPVALDSAATSNHGTGNVTTLTTGAITTTLADTFVFFSVMSNATMTAQSWSNGVNLAQTNIKQFDGYYMPTTTISSFTSAATWTGSGRAVSIAVPFQSVTASTATAPGFEIDVGPNATASHQPFQTTDYQSAPIFSVPVVSNGSITVYGDRLNVDHPIVSGSYLALTGRGILPPRYIPCIEFPDGPSYQGMHLWSGKGTPMRQVTDMVTNSTTTITSASATFSSSLDQGAIVIGTDIPANTYIVSVANSTTAVISQAATGSHSGGSLTISKIGSWCNRNDMYERTDTPTTSNQRIYQCTKGGTPDVQVWVGIF